MSSLESKIRALLEGHSAESISEEELETLEEKETITTKSGTTITDDDSDESADSKKDSDPDDDGDADEDNDNDGDGDDTDVAKDTKKDKADVVQEETTGLKQGADNVIGGSDTAKIKAGQSRKDEVKSGKLTNDTSTGDLDSHEVKMMGKESDGSADTLPIVFLS